MKNLYFLLFIALLTSCNTLKRAEKSIDSGDYNQAFDLLVKKYQNGLSDKNHDKFLPSFQEAYKKMVDAEEDKIERLKMENNPAFAQEIYETLVQLDQRQSALKALLPLYYKGKKLHFETKNYANAIQKSKTEYVNFLYDQSLDKMATNRKQEFREAYNDLSKIQKLSPNFADTKNLMQEAHYMGMDFILLNIENRSNVVIPKRLENELTQINTYGLDNFWVEFHTNENAQIEFDYLIKMDFEQITVSPERMNTVTHRFEREIVDGWEYLYQNGQQVVDSLGNPIKVDKYINVIADVQETIQEKMAMMQGEVKFIDLTNSQIVDREKLYSEFAFVNHFANMRGDQRALDYEMNKLVNNRPIPFPSNEQMVYDCGNELKSQLRSILKRMF